MPKTLHGLNKWADRVPLLILPWGRLKLMQLETSSTRLVQIHQLMLILARGYSILRLALLNLARPVILFGPKKFQVHLLSTAQEISILPVVLVAQRILIRA